MQGELTRIIQQSVQECRRSAREVAKEVGKPYPLFMREINPADLRAKIGVESLAAIMRATGDIAPLAHLARSLNYAVTPLTIRPSTEKSREKHLLDIAEGVGRFCAAVRRAIDEREPTLETLLQMQDAQSDVASAMGALTEAIRRNRDCSQQV